MKKFILSTHLIAALLVTVVIIFVCLAIPQQYTPQDNLLIRMAGLSWVICMSVLFIHCGWMMHTEKNLTK
ncbi:hypothetical protein [Foetidibacter luteolus]|uniref:hypothetical protein n=1 Tax=Foetidibacter luteolus TaxID=2608880 RepID=UPI001A98FB7F|nr:hypothetical protein [Foetidibacter luteolus]